MAKIIADVSLLLIYEKDAAQGTWVAFAKPTVQVPVFFFFFAFWHHNSRVSDLFTKSNLTYNFILDPTEVYGLLNAAGVALNREGKNAHTIHDHMYACTIHRRQNAPFGAENMLAVWWDVLTSIII
ncbi:hypothetical protein ACJX0J_026968 [Zea mays]